ncbi:MAG: hypothetical protein ACRYGL_20145 [Janthinobacterium lividum]
MMPIRNPGNQFSRNGVLPNSRLRPYPGKHQQSSAGRTVANNDTGSSDKPSEYPPAGLLIFGIGPTEFQDDGLDHPDGTGLADIVGMARMAPMTANFSSSAKLIPPDLPLMKIVTINR